MYLLEFVHSVQPSQILSNVRSKSNYSKWMPITTSCLTSSHDTVCADCCANITKLIKSSLMCFEAGRSWIFCEINTGIGIIQQFIWSKLFACIPLHQLPENNVSSLVSFPCLNQCKVSSDGLFHDVVPAIELFYLCTMTTHLKESEALDAVDV